MAVSTVDIALFAEVCKFCRRHGHRIYNKDMLGCDGQRVVECPVLIERKKRRQQKELFYATELAWETQKAEKEANQKTWEYCYSTRMFEKF